MRKVMVRPERNGYVYVLDRATGEVLSADPFAYITTTKGIDLKSGRPILAPDKENGPRLARRQGLAALGLLAATAALGFAGATKGGMLYVFSLP